MVKTDTVFVNDDGDVRVYRNDKGQLFIGDNTSSHYPVGWLYVVIDWSDVPAFIAEIQRIYAEQGAD